MSTPSLLIPTVADHADAHEDIEQEQLYREKIRELKLQSSDFPWDFEVVRGFFKQSEPETDDSTFNYATDNFGTLKPWKQIILELKVLNETSKDNEMYKLFFLARHGQGFHNVVINKYTFEEWYRVWYKETHDGDMQYAPDAMLTELGINQAKENNLVWKQQLQQGAPMPAKFFVSPLQRSSHTLVHTWEGLKPQSCKPIVTELIRETNGLNLCDKRLTKTVISERFGKHGFVFEEGFTEEDQLFDHNKRETMVEHCIRTNKFLQQIFELDFNSGENRVHKEQALQNTFISTTSHAGTIRTFITVLGHRRFTISTGAMIPIVVKATRRLLC